MIKSNSVKIRTENGYIVEGDELEFLLGRVTNPEYRDKISDLPLTKHLDCKEFFYDHSIGLWRLTSSQYGCIINCKKVTYIVTEGL